MIKKKSQKINISKIITIIVLGSLAFASFNLGLHIHDKGKEITDFCTQHYHDKEFMNLFYDKEPYVLKSCYDKNPKEVFKMHSENYRDICPEITEEQLEFSRNCGWMDKDYFILVGTLFFGFFLPAFCLIMIGAALAEMGEFKDGNRQY